MSARVRIQDRPRIRVAASGNRYDKPAQQKPQQLRARSPYHTLRRRLSVKSAHIAIRNRYNVNPRPGLVKLKFQIELTRPFPRPGINFSATSNDHCIYSPISLELISPGRLEQSKTHDSAFPFAAVSENFFPLEKNLICN